MSTTSTELLASDAAWLCLAHPTPEELLMIWNDTASEWRGALPVSKWLEECQYLETVPLARNKGMTHWILVDSRLKPNERQILSSCESFRKHALTSRKGGEVKDVIVHSIASVFCVPQYRGRGYAKRMMQELSRVLRNWQLEGSQCIGSILYSDIGKEYYAKLGWTPHSHNFHVEFKPTPTTRSPTVVDVLAGDLAALCERDEERLRETMAKRTDEEQTRFVIIPNVDHIGWHLANEDFACNFIFGEAPKHKGAVAGTVGNRVWIIWTHRYYDHPEKESCNNVLYVLRLVLEGDTPFHHHATKEGGKYIDQTQSLKAVLQAAQQEAHTWKLDKIQLWDPTPSVRSMLTQIDIEYKTVERQNTSIASALWYHGNDDKIASEPLWLNNEHYAWC